MNCRLLVKNVMYGNQCRLLSHLYRINNIHVITKIPQASLVMGIPSSIGHIRMTKDEIPCMRMRMRHANATCSFPCSNFVKESQSSYLFYCICVQIHTDQSVHQAIHFAAFTFSSEHMETPLCVYMVFHFVVAFTFAYDMLHMWNFSLKL